MSIRPANERERYALERDQLRGEILDRATAGATYRTIAAELGLETRQVYGICRRAGAKAPRQPRPPDAAITQRDREILEDVRAGISMGAAARRYGISRQRVDQICQREGVRPRLPRGCNIAPEDRAALRERDLAIIERVGAGASTTTVSHEFGLSANYVRSICRKAGIEPPPRPRNEVMVQRDRQIVEQVLAGSTTVAIARAFGISQTTASKICLRAGLRRRQTDAALHERDLMIIKQVKAGESFAAISREVGVTPSRIQQICSKAGVKANRRDESMAQRDLIIIKQVRAGGALKAVAHAFGLSPGRVWHICERAGVRSKYVRGPRSSS
jgi:DNA-binding CsgD family transcriptional regulator